LDFASLKPLSFENPLLEKMEEKGAYRAKPPWRTKLWLFASLNALKIHFFHEVMKSGGKGG